VTAAFTYRFFDRSLISEVALPSMSAPGVRPPAAGDAGADDSDSPNRAPASSSPGQGERTAIRNTAAPAPVRLIWDSALPPDAPRTPITAGRPAGFEAWRTPDGFLFTTATWSVAVSRDGDEVTVHGARDAEHASRIAHPLTNTVLARLPALWGMFPMHAAALATPAGAVVISGASGAGKSTLSQWLVQHEGWALLDDDAIAIAPEASAVWGMGGVPRLWPDAASALGMAGTQLPGHPAGKLAVAPPRQTTPSQPLVGMIHLFADPRETEGAPTGANLEAVRAPQAVRLTSRAVLSMELQARTWLAARLQFCQHAAAKPNALLRYVKSEASLYAVGRGVGQWVATLGQQPIG